MSDEEWNITLHATMLYKTPYYVGRYWWDSHIHAFTHAVFNTARPKSLK